MGSEGRDTNIFELLALKHDRAYLNVYSEEIMFMMKKCNTFTREIACYTKYIRLSVIQLTKPILRTATCWGNMQANIAKNLFWDKIEQL